MCNKFLFIVLHRQFWSIFCEITLFIVLRSTKHVRVSLYLRFCISICISPWWKKILTGYSLYSNIICVFNMFVCLFYPFLHCKVLRSCTDQSVNKSIPWHLLVNCCWQVFKYITPGTISIFADASQAPVVFRYYMLSPDLAWPSDHFWNSLKLNKLCNSNCL